jgi:hypothetical protein
VAERAFGVRRGRRAWWFVAFLAVPTALAGVALGWPGQQVTDDLYGRSESALTRAGLAGVDVTFDGRDAWLGNVPAGAEPEAVTVVEAVHGVRDVYLLTTAVPPTGSIPTAAVPTPPPEEGMPDEQGHG